MIYSLLYFHFANTFVCFVVVLGEEKRRQVGEMTPDGQLRFFNEQELIERERETWFTRIFGTESWTNSVRRR